MINEQWKPVHEYEGFYEVSDTGMVRSLDRVVSLSEGKKRRVKGRSLIPKQNADDYHFVSLSKEGVTKTKYVHRLVAQAFLANPMGLLEVNHLSGNKSDNTTTNLTWVNHQENVRHAYDTDLCNNKGGNHYFAVGIIDNLLGKEFETVKEWSIARGIAYSTARNVLNGTNKSRTIDLTGVVRIFKNKTNE